MRDCKNCGFDFATIKMKGRCEYCPICGLLLDEVVETPVQLDEKSSSPFPVRKRLLEDKE